MRDWCHRPEEVRNLLNPAFCGRVLCAAVAAFQKKCGCSLPFPLVYLILPLVLPSRTRHAINSRTHLLNWVQVHQDLIYDFGQRARDLVVVTNEAMEFMLQAGFLVLTDEGELSMNHSNRSLGKTRYADDEVRDCLTKAEHVGRWFATAGKVETIYVCLGVRP